MKILILGATGLLGYELKNTFLAKGYDVLTPSHDSLDITDSNKLLEYFECEGGKFQWCINCVGYTKVDLAEKKYDDAKSINVTAVEQLAALCAKYKIRMLHFSTDFVFDGKKSSLYTEEDGTNPINVYGKTKLLGEEKVLESSSKHIIARTSFLYGKNGPSFFKTLFEKFHHQDEFEAVEDIRSCPTYAPDLASRIMLIIEKDIPGGIYHVSGEECLSRYDAAIRMKNIYIREFGDINFHIIPVLESKWNAPAQRPQNSSLSNKKLLGVGVSGSMSFDVCITEYMKKLRSMVKT